MKSSLVYITFLHYELNGVTLFCITARKSYKLYAFERKLYAFQDSEGYTFDNLSSNLVI